jgi:ABC-type transporter Mla subunit MlaD
VSTTFGSLFVRPKSLKSILSTFVKAASDLDAFVQHAETDISSFNAEIGKLADGRAAAENEKSQALRVRAKLADLIA